MAKAKLTKHGLIMRAHNAQKKYPEWRYGQALFNCLLDLDPEIAEILRGSIADPFYATAKDDARVTRFFKEIFG